MPQWSDIASEIVSGAGHVGSAIVSEAKNIGGSAATQVTGKAFNPSSPQSPKTDNASVTDTHSINEFKNFGGSFATQIFGSHVPDVKSREEINKMDSDDKKFSDDNRAAIKARITKIYEEYENKRKQEEKLKDQQEEQEEFQKQKQLDQIQEKRFREQINPAIQKSRAEIKNFGSE